jgi:hypothetical protein
MPYIDPTRLDKIYREYGFKEVEHACSEGLRVYSQSDGYFKNAVIVPYLEEASGDAREVKEKLDDIGYASVIRKYDSASDVEENLFESYFAAEDNRRRLEKEYERFTSSISDTIGSEYSYVKVDFTVRRGIEVNEDIISYVRDKFYQDGPVLIIVEAPAGFGKTCTTFEILRKSLEEENNRIPILTRFSLNRQAKIFRYVLLDEIDRNFPNLESDLVTRKIKEGRTPLLLDGFDELISRGKGIEEEKEDAEPMIQTISDLLEDNAKILMTSRKTALFTEDEFEEWIYSESSDAEVIRVNLHPPTISDWLGDAKTEMIENSNLDKEAISNPVILSFLRNTDPDEFEEACTSPDIIVNSYFDKLLSREKRRQDLPVSVEDQLKIFVSLADSMVRYSFTSEKRDLLQMRLKEQNETLLEEIKTRYPGDSRTSVDNLVSKLSNHALLNRSGAGADQIGFVNDFILGILSGNAIRESKGEALIESDSKELFVDKASTAYISQTKALRRELWEYADHWADEYTATEQLLLDLRLMGAPQRGFEEEYIEGVTLRGLCIGNTQPIKDTTFRNCIFENVVFDPSGLSDVVLDSCSFYNIFIRDSNGGPIWVHNPKAYNESKCRLRILDENSNFFYRPSNDENLRYFEHIIIRNLCFSEIDGPPTLDSRLLKMERDDEKIEEIDRCIRILSEKGLIRTSGHDIIAADIENLKSYVDIQE